MRKETGIRFIIISILTIVMSISFINNSYSQNNLKTIVNSNNEFAFDLFHQLRKDKGNLFFSPYSISSVLSMVYAGAKGNTSLQMGSVLHFNQPKENLCSSFKELQSNLVADLNNKIAVNINNSIWLDKDYPFLNSFTSIIKDNYGAVLETVNFKQSYEAARIKINKWVENKTNGKIKDLIPLGIFDKYTRLVLVNTVYFKAAWYNKFKKAKTKNDQFYLSTAKSISVPMMYQKEDFMYAEDKYSQIIKLPYEQEYSMWIFLPKEKNGIQQTEESLKLKHLNELDNLMIQYEVDLYLPRFKMEEEQILSKILSFMGMKDAFHRQLANFTGMATITKPEDNLYITAVIHKAFIEVNEEGTEAAAATAAVMAAAGCVMIEKKKVTFKADHPFIFLIRNNSNGTILFMGRLMNPH